MFQDIGSEVKNVSSLQHTMISTCLICDCNLESIEVDSFNGQLLEITYGLLKVQEIAEFRIESEAEIYDVIHFCTSCRLALMNFRNINDEMKALEIELVKIQTHISETLSKLSTTNTKLEYPASNVGLVLRDRVQFRLEQKCLYGQSVDYVCDESDLFDETEVAMEVIIENAFVVNEDPSQICEPQVTVDNISKPNDVVDKPGGVFGLKPCTVGLVRFEDELNCELPVSKADSPLIFDSKNRTFHLKYQKKHNSSSLRNNMKNYSKYLRDNLPNKFKLKCSRCKMEFKRLKDLSDHILREGCTLTPDPSLDRTNSQFDLPWSNPIKTSDTRTPANYLQLAKARKRHISPRLEYKCPHCGKQLQTKRTLEYHVEIKHTNPPKARKLKKISHVCEFCNKPYRTTSCLMTHQLSKHYEEYLQKSGGDKKLVERRRDMYCEICDRTFCSKEARNVHFSARHSQEFKFCCEDCGKGFAKYQTMMRHQISHKNERKYACDQCPLRFNIIQNLTRHLKHVHFVGGKTKTSACVYCSRVFWYESELKRHIQIKHKDQLPEDAKEVYMCEICNYTCPDKLYLKSHMKTRKHKKQLAVVDPVETTIQYEYPISAGEEILAAW